MSATKLIIVGLGPAGADYISVGALEALKSASLVLVRTSHHRAVEQLTELGIAYQPLDWVYETSAAMSDVYPKLADEVLKAAQGAGGPVAYAVPGSPVVAEASVQILLQRAGEAGLTIEIISSVSVIEVCLAKLGFDPLAGLLVADAQALPARLDPTVAVLFLQIDSRLRASELKLSLLEAYPPEHEVTFLQSMGNPTEEKVLRLPLAELDHREDFNHLTSLFVPALAPAQRPVVFTDLVELMATLRSENGCPWDREQTHESLKVCLEEESGEVLEAIDSGNPESLCEELGDVLLQVLFHAQLASEAGDFTIGDVLRVLRDKLVERHPHVFGEEKLQTAAEVLEAWEAIKRRTRS